MSGGKAGGGKSHGGAGGDTEGGRADTGALAGCPRTLRAAALVLEAMLVKMLINLINGMTKTNLLKESGETRLTWQEKNVEKKEEHFHPIFDLPLVKEISGFDPNELFRGRTECILDPSAVAK